MVKAVASVDLQHHVNVGAAVSGVDDVIGSGDVLDQQLVEDGHLAIACSGANDRVDLAGGFVAELGAENVILRNDALERGVNHLDGRGRQNVEVEGE
jgi:hypothetical protein